MPGLIKECDVVLGFVFTQDGRSRVGHIERLVLGDHVIQPDIAVANPRATGGLPGQPVYTKSVVAVLQGVRWSTLPNESITLNACISIANRQTLGAIPLAAKTPVAIAFGVYEWDNVANTYYTSFMTKEGTVPSIVKPGSPAATVGYDEFRPVYGLVKPINVKIGAVAETAPVHHFALELILDPIVAPAPQKLQIQSSNTNKLVKGWGLPQM